MRRWRTTAHEKVLYFDEGGNVRDRFDTSATSLSNSMIRMPYKHHCLSLADTGEARMREFDSRLASRGLALNREEQTHPIARRCYRLSFLFPLSPLSFFFLLVGLSTLFHERVLSKGRFWEAEERDVGTGGME